MQYQHHDPGREVLSERSGVRIRSCNLIDMILDLTKVAEPLHKTQLLDIRASHRDKGYINRTKFNQLVSMFKRYSEKLEKSFSTVNAEANESNKRVLALAMTEAEEYQKKIDEVLVLLSGGSEGSFEVRKRVVT